MENVFVIETALGRVELHGTGPWSVKAVGDGSFEILDSAGNRAKPTFWQNMRGGGCKPNQNVIWAKPGAPTQIVEEANKALAAK